MSIKVINAGLQTTLQGSPYSGHRHIGMPAAGAADSLSLALANKLVGNGLGDLALEITLTGASFKFGTPTIIALTGAICDIEINRQPQAQYRTIRIDAGDKVMIGPTQKGCRAYLAVGGRFDVRPVLGGRSTYQPAILGGYQGRALKVSDIIEFEPSDLAKNLDEIIPDSFIPTFSDGVILRITLGPEYDELDDASKTQLFKNIWIADQRMSRMGMMLAGPPLQAIGAASMPSAPVFPGTIQCPPNGKPFLLGPDAQTTGGYSRIAQIIRADRHLIGQLKPGSKIQLVQTTPERATTIYREKLALLKPLLGEIKLW